MARTDPTKHDTAILAQMLTLADDPLAFVMYAYPWGVEGTPLAQADGPRRWQVESLREVGEHIRENRRRKVNGEQPEVFKESTVAGRGPGKTARLAWLAHWQMSCHIGSTTIVTANTDDQLRTRMWPELGKWHTMSIHQHWFERTATALKPQPWFAAACRDQLGIDAGYYYAQAQLWNEENPDAFAGAHNPLGMMVLFDEASGIPASIWKVTAGFFSDICEHRYWFVSSNGRRNTGAFFETHHRDREFWRRRKINSLDVEGIDHSELKSIIRQYGEDSDEARVEVYGDFPRQGDNQFIGRDLIDAAVAREDFRDRGAPLVMGVDVARYGSDHSVIVFRQGRDIRAIPYKKYKGLDTVQVAMRVAELADEFKPDAIFVEGNGVGAGVVDTLKGMHYRPIEVDSGSKSDDNRYKNKRTELWGRMREWLPGATIPNDDDLRDDLAGPEYDIPLDGRLRLETKEQMKKRGLASPDIGDALAMTFARNVQRRDIRGDRMRRATRARDVDYDLFA